MTASICGLGRVHSNCLQTNLLLNSHHFSIQYQRHDFARFFWIRCAGLYSYDYIITVRGGDKYNN